MTPTNNDKVRKKIKQDIKAYLAKGGTITKVPTGYSKKLAVDFVTKRKQEINV